MVLSFGWIQGIARVPSDNYAIVTQAFFIRPLSVQTIR